MTREQKKEDEGQRQDFVDMRIVPISSIPLRLSSSSAHPRSVYPRSDSTSSFTSPVTNIPCFNRFLFEGHIPISLLSPLACCKGVSPIDVGFTQTIPSLGRVGKYSCCLHSNLQIQHSASRARPSMPTTKFSDALSSL